MYQNVIKEIESFMNSNSMIGRRTHAMYTVMVDAFDNNVSEEDKKLHANQVAGVVADGGFDNKFTIMDEKELLQLIGIILDHTMVIDCPVNIDDIVYIIEDNNVIPCKVKLTRAVKSSAKNKPVLEIYVTTISKNDKLQGCATNIMNSIDPSCEAQDSSTWITMAMYGSYWFLTEDDAKSKLK